MGTLRSGSTQRLDVVQPGGEWQDEPQPPWTTSTEIIRTSQALESASRGGSKRNDTLRPNDSILVDAESRGGGLPPLCPTDLELSERSPATGGGKKARQPDRPTPPDQVWFEDEEPQRTRVIGVEHVEELVWKVRI